MQKPENFYAKFYFSDGLHFEISTRKELESLKLPNEEGGQIIAIGRQITNNGNKYEITNVFIHIRDKIHFANTDSQFNLEIIVNSKFIGLL